MLVGLLSYVVDFILTPETIFKLTKTVRLQEFHIIFMNQ